MTTENKEILIKRLKSFLWRMGMLLLAATIDFILVNLEVFDLPNQITVVTGLVFGEISKYLNSKHQTGN